MKKPDEYFNNKGWLKYDNYSYEDVIELMTLIQNDTIESLNKENPPQKKYFYFDYIIKIYNKKGQRFGEMETEAIEAYDEEHAILLFEKQYPDVSYDPPYC